MTNKNLNNFEQVNDMKNESIKNNTTQNQDFLFEEINKLFSKIKICLHYKDADIYFDQLLAIQEMLGSLVFKYDIKILPSLRKFVRDCERLDDDDVRKWLFNELKSNQYSLK